MGPHGRGAYLVVGLGSKATVLTALYILVHTRMF